MRYKRMWALALVLVLLLAACVRSFAAGTPRISTDAAAAEADPVAADEAQPSALVEAVTSGALALPCKAALLMSSDTGEVLYEDHADDQLAMASITKVMTLLLTFEALDAGAVRLDDIVPVSQHAFSMGGSQIWLEPGEQFTLHEMIKAICVSSANDAAVAVAEFVGGSEPAFVEMMNARAAQLGMTNTCFKNACGLDEEGHYSSARDVAVMSLALMQHEDVFEYTSIWTDTLRNGETLLTNTNKLLRSYEGITGLKTGTTSRAGVCISATATKNGTGLIAVILGSNSSKERFAAATALLDYGFANFERVDVPAPTDMPAEVPVRGGGEQTVALRCDMPDSLVVAKGAGSALHTTVELDPALHAPLAAQQQVGQVTLYNGETAVASYPVLTDAAVEAMSFSLAMQLLYQALFTL